MRRLLIVLPFLFAIQAMAQAQPDWSKVEIRAEKLAPGVAVLFGQGGNIGLSYGPDGTVLIDDQFAPLTPKIAAAIARIGAQPVRFLINTHFHFDHTSGNENFGKAGATIFAHDSVRVRLAEASNVLGNAVPAAPAAALPVVTYGDRVSFHLNGDEIQAIHTGGGHTDGDSVVFWRKANVLHTGDLMMKDMGFPFIDTGSGGSAVKLVDSLDRLIVLTNDETKIIPGHGPVATRGDLLKWRTMIADALDVVRKAREGGRTLAQLRADNPFKAMEKPKAFITADVFVQALWASLDKPK
jgi:glyoxylase-like metal-dependent hydrolase (beta-lactamase superfamily II)